MPKVSIIVPVYNVEEYLERCLDSLAKQTLKDIEVILVNDGSTDGSKDILKTYEEKYSNFKYFEKENGGLSDARNYGIPHANGEYIAFLDSDDYVEFDMYEKMYNKAIENNADMVECDFVWEYPNKRVIDTGHMYNNKKEMFRVGRVVAWNKIIKKSIIDEKKIRFPKGLRYEDVEFFYKMLPYYNKINFVREPLIYYIQRPSSISNSQNEKTKDIFQILDNVILYYKQEELYEEYKNVIEYTYARLVLCSSLARVAKIKDRKIRRNIEIMTWENLNSNFPEWKKNKILMEKNKKNLYMKIINKYTFKIICIVLRFL